MSDLTWATGPDSGCLGLVGNLLVSGGQHLATLDLSSWTLTYIGPGRPREQCLVLSAATSRLGDAVFFASGALFNMTSRTWTFLPAPPTSFNMALVNQKGFETKPNHVQVGGLPTMVGLAHQNGSSLVGDSTIWQLDIGREEWRQVAQLHHKNSNIDIPRWENCCNQGWHTQPQLKFHHPCASPWHLQMTDCHQQFQKVNLPRPLLPPHFY